MAHKYDNIVEVVVGVLVVNKKGEILVADGEKWKGHYTVPGGHVEYGEKIEDAVKREVQEEVGLVLDRIAFLNINEAIFPKEFHRKAHFIFLNYVGWVDGDPQVKLCQTEFDSFMWVDPEKALKEVNLKDTVRMVIEEYIKRYVKRS